MSTTSSNSSSSSSSSHSSSHSSSYYSSPYLSFQWPRTDNANFVCWHRGFDNSNANIMVALLIPWIQWPNNPLDDANSHWTVIQDKAHQAFCDWRRALREKVSGEAHQKHMKLTSIILMNSQLRLTVDSLVQGEEHMMLFYGFVADELMEMEDVRDLRMGKSVIKWIGSGEDAYPVVRNFRSRA
ncbi:hypothetical protein FPOAC2_07027 [Fusarium poae]|uniref:Uncharacterized protein n=2 Tax=Fusarium poae TaxID=36050 RepID=A0A1B8AZ50_FUSPO|nr:hypothetical protein FPOA_06303 [Fusarium poae]